MPHPFKVLDELPAGRSLRDEPVDWVAAKQALIDNPGKWVLMAENIASSVPGQLRDGSYKDFRGAELAHFEFRVRKPEKPAVPYAPRRTDLYGRYTKRLKK
jgi:hypothetical protein